ncbi:hypothetical protein [Moorena sp. SIOASIH]|uniref:hypothetical protein n=1 Tax=Moorena sp. SIOASIH TaxID=2607817 RepID=UPI0025D90EC8|nr:hypothetical protein [Moorena sp. SIOASIH]
MRYSEGTATRTQNLLHLIDHPFELTLSELKVVMNTQLASPPPQHDSLNVATAQTSCEEGGIVTDAIGEDGHITTFAIRKEGGIVTDAIGEDVSITTFAIGEEGGASTLALSEEGGDLLEALSNNLAAIEQKQDLSGIHLEPWPVERISILAHLPIF